MRKSQGVSFTVWLADVVKTGRFKIKDLSKLYDEDVDSSEVKTVGD
tara:strand:+ start:164 stop:301 length:138 start_codon:yes stop_codon:yes gene_type:complete